ncbi:MAG TPA: hypothetical protein VFQ23_15570, partial [Anaerolineales bacterium]|nr:hypothetical protein [Anaerolineales bacterium]
FNSNSFQGNGGPGTSPDLPPQFTEFFQWVEQNLTAFLVGTVAIVCLIWIVTIFLSTIGKVGLIRGTAQIDGGAEGLIFGQLFSESTPYFWRMLGLSLILSLPVFIFAMIIAVFAIFGLAASQGSDASGLGFFATFPLLIGCVCLLVPVMLVLGVIFRQAENALVLEEMGVLPALSRGWEVFRNNLGPVIIMAIILAVIGFAAGFVLALPIFVILVPAFIAVMAGEAQSMTPLAIAGVCICLYFPVSLVLSGIAIAYTESAWTLMYMRLTKPQIAEPVILPEANE